MAHNKKKSRYSPEATEKLRISRHNHWLDEAKARHADRFSYPNTIDEYDKRKEGDLTIICNKHNISFYMLPDIQKMYLFFS